MSAHPPSLVAAMVGVGGALALAGLAIGLSARRSSRAAREGDRAGEAGAAWRLAGVGALSQVTRAVCGFALAGIGYHLIVHALGYTQFRAPLGVAVGVGLAAILGTIGVDALENRLDRGADAEGPEEPTESGSSGGSGGAGDQPSSRSGR